MLELKSSITKQQKCVSTGFLSRCMQYGLKNQWSRDLFKHSINADWLSLSSCTPTVSLIQRSWVLSVFHF